MIDCDRRCVVGMLDLERSVSDARRILARPPDTDEPGFVSWGRLSAAELMALDPDADEVGSLLTDGCFVCLYYCDDLEALSWRAT